MHRVPITAFDILNPALTLHPASQRRIKKVIVSSINVSIDRFSRLVNLPNIVGSILFLHRRARFSNARVVPNPGSRVLAKVLVEKLAKTRGNEMRTKTTHGHLANIGQQGVHTVGKREDS